MIGKFIPTVLQLIGVSLFVVSFVLMSANISGARQDAKLPEHVSQANALRRAPDLFDFEASFFFEE